MKRTSINEKLIFYFVLIGLIAIVSIGTYSYYFSKKALLNRTFDQLISLRLEKKNRIEQFFLDRTRDINLISKSDEIKKIIDGLSPININSKKPDKLQFNSYLSKYISSYGYYQKIYVINKNNNIVDINSANTDSVTYSSINSTSNKNLKHFCNKLELSETTIIQDLTKSKLLIYIGTAVLNEAQEISGFVVLEIPVTAINKIMFGYTENNGLGETGETYLVGNDSLMRSNSRFKENAIFSIKVNSQSVKNALNGETGNHIVKDYRNVLCLSSYSKVNIQGLNWVILAEIDELEAMIPVNSIRNSILFISIFIAMAIFIFALVISGRITLPIKKLQKASEQIGAGNYDIILEVLSKDEIGMLTETFNNMTLQLKKQNEEIEKQKKKRLSSLIDGQEMERQRLSRDLHDSLGQSLLAVKIKLEQAKSTNIETKHHIIIETQELLRNAIQEIRNITNDLMPPVLEAFGIADGLKNFCKDIMSNTSLKIELISENIPTDLNKKIQIYLYRISQEAINNITKHSEATKVDIKLTCINNIIFLNIADNGKGFFHNQKDNKGNGILNIKERVELLKGECNITSIIGEGTQIYIKIPILYEKD